MQIKKEDAETSSFYAPDFMPLPQSHLACYSQVKRSLCYA